MKASMKWFASLVLASSLTSCSSIEGLEAPSSFQIPSVLSIELGADGCPIEEPCFGYEAELEAEEARAWAAYDSYNFAPLDLPFPIQQNYVSTYVGSVPELSEGFWMCVDPYDHDVVYVFESVALTEA